MKKITSLILVLMLSFMAHGAFAESNAISPSAYVDEEIAQPYASSRRAFIEEGSYLEIYDSPFRQRHVYVTFNSSEGPARVKVMLLTYGDWTDILSPQSIRINESCHFDWSVAAKYRVLVMSDDPGVEGYCRFTIEATP